MKNWFEGNPLAIVLGSICATLLVISLVLGVVWSLPPSSSAGDTDENTEELTLEIPELAESEPIETYAVITERPVFNQSRLPFVDDESGEGEGDALAEEEVDAPEFQLVGVIITPSIRMVTLKSKDQPESLVAFEGQPLEGNYGSWQVSRIEPRQITLASGRGQETQLQLQIHDATIAAPPKPAAARESAPVAEAGEQVNDDGGDQPLTRAEEIRQRIAERREELRRAAEENDEDPMTAAEYRRTIQSQLTGVRPKEKTDEN